MMRIEGRRRWVQAELPDWTFVVIGSSGFRAELRACLCERTVCVKPLTISHNSQHSVDGKTSVDAWLRHAVDHCHGWHWPTVERFMADVLATYGAKSIKPKPVGIARGNPGVSFVGVGYIHRKVSA